MQINHFWRKLRYLIVLYHQWHEIVECAPGKMVGKASTRRYINLDKNIKEAGCRKIQLLVIAWARLGLDFTRTYAQRSRRWSWRLIRAVVPDSRAHSRAASRHVQRPDFRMHFASARTGRAAG